MKRKKLLFVPLVLALIYLSFFQLESCKAPDQQKTEDTLYKVGMTTRAKHVDWLKNAVIYEVNVRQYTLEGTFAAFIPHIQRLKNMGVDVLWFMPISPIGEKNRKGKLGSYYSVKDYTAINPEFGNLEDFKKVVAEAHKLGMKVIIDWVANHTAWDSKWISEHPDWYAKDSTGKIIAPFDWTDVAKLDYKNQDMRKAMIESLKFWLTNADIDGFRCDVAGEVPTDFWATARKELDAVKPIMMLAEAEKAELLADAFDLDYGWEFMHLMNGIAKGEKRASDIDKYLAKLDSVAPKNSYKMYFTTNHDENSWNGTEYERYKGGAETFAVLTATLPGNPLIYSGQEAALKKRLLFFEKDTINFTKLPLEKFYSTITSLRKSNQALLPGTEGGKVEKISTSNDEVMYCFQRVKGAKKIVVITNLTDKAQKVSFTSTLPTGESKNVFTKEKKDLSKLKDITLKPWEYQVYEQ
jgi:glycosidase